MSDWMASAGRRACLYRLAPPLPLGAGEYVRPAGVVSVGGEGVGVFSRFSLSRGPSSCHLIISVVIASRPLGLLASLPPSSSSSCPMRAVISRLRPMCFALVLSAPLASVLVPVFSCGFLSLPSPFLRRAGRGVLACLLACLLVSFVAVLFLSSRFPHSLRSSSLVHVLACPTGIALVVLVYVLVVASARVSSPFSSRSCLTVFDKRGRGGCRLVICLLTPVLGCGFLYRAGGWAEGCCLLASRMADGVIGGGLRTAWALAWLLACFGWRRAMWCRRRVVFGLWCRCLYI